MKRNMHRIFGTVLALITAFALLGCTQNVGISTVPPGTSVHVPILMYHHFSDEPNDSTIVSPETLRLQLEFIKENGFTAISFDELYEFAAHGTPLPDKPVCITFDDGYYSNYSIAFPILRELGMKATVFPVGWCIGKSEYKDTGVAIFPHFGFDEMREMLDSGIIYIGSHTYDMHQSRLYETAEARPNVLPLENESRESYVAALTADLERYSVLFGKETGMKFTVLAYPEGEYNETSEEIIHAYGIPITLTTRCDTHNYVTVGELGSLHALSRLNVSEQTANEALLAWLNGVNYEN